MGCEGEHQEPCGNCAETGIFAFCLNGQWPVRAHSQAWLRGVRVGEHADGGIDHGGDVGGEVNEWDLSAPERGCHRSRLNLTPRFSAPPNLEAQRDTSGPSLAIESKSYTCVRINRFVRLRPVRD